MFQFRRKFRVDAAGFLAIAVALGLGSVGCSQSGSPAMMSSQAPGGKPVLTSCCVRPGGAAAHSSIVQAPSGLRFQSCGCGKGPRWEPAS